MNRNKAAYHFLLLFLLFGGASLFMHTKTACAGAAGTSGDSATLGCDPDTYVEHANRALLQGQRETLALESFITKGDSVLEYTCFNEMMEPIVADQIAPIFSESEKWVARPVELVTSRTEMTEIDFTLGPDSMNEALEGSVIEQAMLYMDSSFGHTFLGGTLPADITAPGVPCPVMGDVWHEAKSKNFYLPDLDGAEVPKPDLFMTFPELQNTDTRTHPEPTDDSRITDEMLEVSQRGNTPAGGFSMPVTYNLDYLQPGDCTQTVYTGVPTHAIIAPGRVGEIEIFEDGACLAPGCKYSMGGNYGGGAGECVP